MIKKALIWFQIIVQCNGTDDMMFLDGIKSCGAKGIVQVSSVYSEKVDAKLNMAQYQ